MLRNGMGLILAMLLLPLSGTAEEQNLYEGLLSRDRIGAREFVRKHPDWNGAGVIVAILDTGVDMTIPGIDKLPDGTPKVIEARDFSGQGLVRLTVPKMVKEGSEDVLQTRDGIVRGHKAVTPLPENGTFLVGFLEERRFRTSSVSDLNNNGSENDKFAVLVAQVKIDGAVQWRAWVDTDGDGHVDDETAVGEYARTLTPLVLRSQGDDRQPALMGLALHFNTARKEVEFHIPDGSHGSHCAGISAGFQLYGTQGYDGIAPGARIMSLKIGDNTLAGGSTTADAMRMAIEFAGEYSVDNKVPVVINLSYGIGSEIEGASEIERIVDECLARFPLLALATSAGNNGPGTSTVGTPAGANFAFSTGAVLTKENALTLYAARLARDVVFYFSSRGGELAKPNGLAPGCAYSTVPGYEGWPTMRGTSMASPQAAGAMALLASAAIQDKPAVPFNGAVLATALTNSGRPIAGADRVDQGSGVIYVSDAYESLKRIGKRMTESRLLGFEVEGDAPTQPNARAPAAFFRTGTYVPKSPVPVRFSVTPVFLQGATTQEVEKYFDSIDLWVEEGKWARPRTDTLVFRKGDAVSLDLFYDASALKSPGIYTSVIHGIPKGLPRDRKSSVFQLWNTVIVPWVFDLTQGFEREWTPRPLPPGESDRFFVRVPEGAGSMEVELLPVSGKFAQSRLTVFDPGGMEYEADESYVDSRRQQNARALVAGRDLTPGVWEVVVMTHYVTPETSHYSMKVSFPGLQFDAPNSFQYEMGDQPRGSFKIRSLFDQVFEGKFQGGIFGYFRKQSYNSTGTRMTIPLYVDKDVVTVRLRMEMTPETYGLFTDCAVNVKDGSGRIITRGGFNRRILLLDVDNPYVGKDMAGLTVEIVGGLASSEKAEWGIVMEERHQMSAQVSARVYCGGFGYFVLHPNRSMVCDFELDGKPPLLPEGYVYWGEFRFFDGMKKTTRAIMPLYLVPQQ